MTPARYQHLMDLFDQACVLPDEQRFLLVARVRAQDPALADELTEMLHCDRETDDLFGGSGGHGDLAALMDDTPTSTRLGVQATNAVARKKSEPPPQLDSKRFRIVRELGSGGMGTVYEAWDEEARTPVALKVLRSQNPKARDWFKKEFRCLAGIEHANLVMLGELGEAGGRWFFTMELVDGVDFLRYLNAAPGDQNRLRDVLAQVVRGLAALHRLNKVHRDIKPSNVLVTRDGRAVILDFGVVVDTAEPDPLSENDVVGTLAYMAPEQFRRGEAGPASDYYAVGVMLYQALTGRLPFARELADIMLQRDIVLRRDDTAPPAPRECTSGVSADLDALCMELLHCEPARRPCGEDILRRLERGDACQTITGSAASQSSGRFPADQLFVGRTDELARLGAAMDERPVTCVIRGGSGVGKTALAESFIATADALVLRGRCYERESVPFKGADGVVDSLARYLARLPDAEVAELVPKSAGLLVQPFPVLGRIKALKGAEAWDGVNVQEMRERVFDALRILVARIAERTRLIVFIDDMQWAGADTWLLLRHLTQPPAAPKLLLLLLMRPEPGSPSPESLPGRPVLTDLDVLPAADAVALSRELLHRAGAPDTTSNHQASHAAIAGQLARESGGHPLFIRELVDYVSEAGASAIRQTRLEDALIARIRRLPAASRDLIELVAAAGAPIAQTAMARAAGLDFTGYQRVVAPLRDARLVHSPGFRPSDPIEYHHDRIRVAVLASLTTQERRGLHARLARSFEDEGLFERSPELALVHLAAAGHERRAADYADLAGKRAMEALAFDHAASLYRTALELGEHDPARALRLTLAHAGALANCGRNAEAAERYLAAADLARDRDTRLECQRLAAEKQLFSGHLATGVEAVDRVLGEIGQRLAPTPRRALIALAWQRVRLRLRGMRYAERSASELSARDLSRLELYKTVTMGLNLVDYLRASEYQARHVRLSLDLGEPTRIARALSLEAFFLASQMSGRSRTVADRAQQLAARSDVPLSRAYSLFARAGVHYFMDNDWAATLECLREGEHLLLAHTQSAGFETDTVRLFRCFCLMQAGDLRDLARWLPDYIRGAQRRGDRYLQVSLRSRLIVPWLVADDPEGAQHELDEAFAAWVPWTEIYTVQHFYGLHSLCEVALYRDRPEVGVAHMAEQYPALKRSFLLRVPLVRAEIDYARVRLAIAQAMMSADRDARAGHLRSARQIARALDKNPAPLARALAALGRAGIARLADDEASAVGLLDQAIAELGRRDSALLVQAARWHRGKLTGGDAGDRERSEARRWLDTQGVADPDRLCRTLVPGFGRARR
ncbi:MAG: protein kinase [Proteobacteria bacterium]|nr:protein kinase [Pseudomonadota bacterium]